MGADIFVCVMDQEICLPTSQVSREMRIGLKMCGERGERGLGVRWSACVSAHHVEDAASRPRGNERDEDLSGVFPQEKKTPSRRCRVSTGRGMNVEESGSGNVRVE